MNDNILMSYIEIVVTTKCTLRCKDCANLMQYYSSPYFIEVDNIKQSVSKLLEAVEKIDMLRILGGEPLLHPNLDEILELVVNSDKINQVQIVTNGTILPTKDSLINILRNKKISISISDYGRYSRKKIELIKLGRMKGIRVMLNQMDRWLDYGDMNCRNKSEQQLKEQYLNCNIGCKSLLKGKIFSCPRSGHGMDLGIIPDNPDEYIDLLDTTKSIDEIREAIVALLEKRHEFMQACNYCNFGCKTKRIRPAIQTKSL